VTPLRFDAYSGERPVNTFQKKLGLPFKCFNGGSKALSRQDPRGLLVSIAIRPPSLATPAQNPTTFVGDRNTRLIQQAGLGLGTNEHFGKLPDAELENGAAASWPRASTRTIFLPGVSKSMERKEH
jgi:hypothetical protein